MKPLNRGKFFEMFPLPEAQETALSQILDMMEHDETLDDLRQCAYFLATIEHETAHTYRPVEEYGKGAGHAYGKPDPRTGQTYYGRGYVQITWLSNYGHLGQVLGLDLINHPELALAPHTSYQIASQGMTKGLFTGRRLSNYINNEKCDYVNARRIINGLDKADKIASRAEHFEECLRASQS